MVFVNFRCLSICSLPDLPDLSNLSDPDADKVACPICFG